MVLNTSIPKAQIPQEHTHPQAQVSATPGMGGGIGGEAGFFPRLVFLRGGIVSFFPGCHYDPNREIASCFHKFWSFSNKMTLIGSDCRLTTQFTTQCLYKVQVIGSSSSSILLIMGYISPKLNNRVILYPICPLSMLLVSKTTPIPQLIATFYANSLISSTYSLILSYLLLIVCSVTCEWSTPKETRYSSR